MARLVKKVVKIVIIRGKRKGKGKGNIKIKRKSRVKSSVALRDLANVLFMVENDVIDDAVVVG